MSFLDELINNGKTRTANDGAAHATSYDAVVDFFATGGAMRSRPGEFVRLFMNAYNANPLEALRVLFYLRDIRGGQGERELFRRGLVALRALDRPTYRKNLHLVPEYGRWDDIVAVWPDWPAGTLIADTLKTDLVRMASGKPVSLMAKWLPSENASSSDSKHRARELMQFLGMTPREYRKTVVSLRKYISLLEQKMSANQWGEVEYGKLPSQAHRKHVRAFRRHDDDRYTEYLAEVKAGRKKINTGTLFTYEVFDLVDYDPEAADVIWNNLPDYTNGNNAIVVADVSGSMIGRPMEISVSLALYFAERNTGVFNGYFITFSESPQLVKVEGETLNERLHNIQNSNWGMNTNLEAVFNGLLDAVLKSENPQEDLPKVIYIISDMQFDRCIVVNDTVFEAAQKKFSSAGLQLPHVVFWNVFATGDHLPATVFDNRVTLISGSSQSTFRYAVEGKSPRQLMEEIISSERYQPLTVANW